uniref:Uncharacterized protein n=1 Tax=Rhizophora mucronata TaxID=61149 RepID=A0A2P2NR08_RHIMU
MMAVAAINWLNHCCLPELQQNTRENIAYLPMHDFCAPCIFRSLGL